MDRLEEIRKKDWQLNNHIFPVHSNKQLCKRDIVWLISEIERLGKALEKIVEREKYISDDEYLPSTAGEIAQQALKEK